MRGALAVVLLFMTMAISGCLVESTRANSDSQSGLFGGSEVLVEKGTDLGEISFSDTGSMSTVVTQPDCVNGGGLTESHQWNIPFTNTEEVPWKAEELTVTVNKAATMSDLDVTLYIGNHEIAKATETGPDDGQSVSVSAFDVPPGQLRILIHACNSAVGDYSIDGVASMIASADVYDNGQAGQIDPASPGSTKGVKVEQKTDGDGDTYYVASREDVFTAKLTGSRGTADFSTGAGQVAYSGESGNDHRVIAVLQARGDSEQQARERLSEMYVDHTATDGPAVLVDVHGVPGGSGWSHKQIDLHIESPADIEWTKFSASSSAGQVHVEHVTATLMELDTSAGQVLVDDVEANELVARTSAGQVLVTRTRANDLVLRTSAGQVIAEMLASTASGAWKLEGSAGQVSVTVKETAAIGYDVDARTSAGSVTFDFRDVQETSSNCQYASCHKQGKTNGYESRAIKITLDLDISAGQIYAGS